jgi:long-chain acyl-CoA synthetase
MYHLQITNHMLQDRVAAFGTGLLRLVGLRPQQSQVLLALNDSIGDISRSISVPVAANAPSEFIISDLAMAAHSITSFTISSSTLLAPVLESHLPDAIITHAALLPQILELIYDAGDKAGNHTIILVGEPSPQAMASVASKVKVLKFEEVEREGVRVEKTITPLPSES